MNATVITNAPTRFSTSPILAISGIRTRSLPKTMALGGVATGIMNAHDADRVAGIISNSGCRFVATATEARIGRIISVVAVLDVNSVRKVIDRQTIRISTNGGTPARPAKALPIRMDSPVTWNP